MNAITQKPEFPHPGEIIRSELWIGLQNEYLYFDI
jgi:hypothetical protein